MSCVDYALNMTELFVLLNVIKIMLKKKVWLHISKTNSLLPNLVDDLTRFNKIAIQGKGPDDKWTRKPLAYRESNIFMCNLPSFTNVT